MERDARGRFVKKGSTAAGKDAKKATSKKSATKGVYKVNFDGLTEELKKLIEDMEAHGFICVGADVVEVPEDKEDDIAACFDKVFRVCKWDEFPKNVTVSTCCKPAETASNNCLSDDVVAALKRAKAKMTAEEAEKQRGTPIDWNIAPDKWVSDLHDIYAEGSIPETDEDMRDEIVSILGDAAKVILGYMCYLEAKDAVAPKHTCKCKGKCKNK